MTFNNLQAQHINFRDKSVEATKQATSERNLFDNNDNNDGDSKDYLILFN